MSILYWTMSDQAMKYPTSNWERTPFVTNSLKFFLYLFMLLVSNGALFRKSLSSPVLMLARIPWRALV